MQELSFEESNIVSGGAVTRQHDLVPLAQSDWGNRLNDGANLLGSFGSWLGSSIYDLTH